MYKYIKKGSDQAVLSIEGRNEVEVFQNGRYLSANEAVWRIFGFPMHDRSPSVQHLVVHLEYRHRVYFTEANVRELVENLKNTTLMDFFYHQQRR